MDETRPNVVIVKLGTYLKAEASLASFRLKLNANISFASSSLTFLCRFTSRKLLGAAAFLRLLEIDSKTCGIENKDEEKEFTLLLYVVERHMAHSENMYVTMACI